MYKSNAKGWNKHLDFMLLDVLMLVVSFVVSVFIRHDGLANFTSIRYREGILALAACSIIVAIMHDSYHRVLKRGYWEEFKKTFGHVALVMALFLAILFLEKNSSDMSRAVVVLTALIGFMSCYVTRVVWKGYVIYSLSNKKTRRRIFLVTSSNMAEDTIRQLRKEGFDFFVDGVALLDRDAKGEAYAGCQVVCNKDEITDFLVNNVVDEVFFRVDRSIVIPKELLEECYEMGMTVHMNILTANKAVCDTYVETFAGYDVKTTTMKYASPRQLIFKRLIDIVGGLVGCVLTGLLCIYVVPKIKKADPGPAFFTQTRVGKNGREFKIYKFRSMYLDAEERKAELMAKNQMSGGMFKMENDPRILPGIGEFIRKTSIDEFPQFFNVLKGDMSLVGTRPPLPSETSEYALDHFRRLAIKPGITGLWQVSGRSDITDFDEVVSLDSQYIRTWNIGMDIKILLKTVLVVLKHEGAR